MSFIREIPALCKMLSHSMPSWEKWFIPSGFTVGTALSFSNIATICGALAALATTVLAIYRIRIAHLELKQKQAEMEGDFRSKK